MRGCFREQALAIERLHLARRDVVLRPRCSYTATHFLRAHLARGHLLASSKHAGNGSNMRALTLAMIREEMRSGWWRSRTSSTRASLCR
jgi:hypothetical protein